MKKVQDKILKKLTLELCHRSPAGALSFIVSTAPLLLYPLVYEGPLHFYYILIVLSILPVNILRFFLAQKIIGRPDNISPRILLAHNITIVLNAACYSLFLALVFWTLNLATIHFTVAIIVLATISAASTSSLGLNPKLQYSFLFLVAAIPTSEFFILSFIRHDQGYGLLAFLFFIFTSYLVSHSRLYYKKMVQLYKYEDQLISEKEQLQLVVIELKEAQEEILNQKARADYASKLAAIGEMASGIAHEINNPLSIIQGNLKHIQSLSEHNEGLNELTKTQFSERSEKIQNSVNRIGRIINGLKLFSRQRKNESLEKVPFQTIIDNTLELCSEKFALNSINLVVKNCPSANLVINTAEITQVLHSLLNNAYEAVNNANNPEVRIELEVKKNFLNVKIIDNGAGIPDEVRNKIFIPFYTSKEIGKGPGLGLSIARGIIEQHGGTIYLEDKNVAHQWTTFVFTLPLAS